MNNYKICQSRRRMVDVAVMYNFNGALYPVELQKSVERQASSVPPLVDLCSARITRDSTATRQAVDNVPPELCINLMQAALAKGHDRAIEVLICHWPMQGLTLRKLAPNLFDDLSCVYDGIFRTARIRMGIKYTTCLAHTFVECLKKRAPTKLKYLDLTGYPTAEVIVNYLASHCLLVYNECRQKEIITVYNEATRELPESERRCYDFDQTLPDDSFVIKLDAFIQTEPTYMELCKALNVSKTNSANCKFRLQVHKLDITCLGVIRISILMEQVDTQLINGLRLQYNAITSDGLNLLTPNLKRLTTLTTLDLSCNNINLTSSTVATQNMVALLSSLPQLKRLDLSNNRIKHKVSQVLGHLAQPLQYVKLAACCLSQDDLKYLRNSVHIRTITELDLSENNLGEHLDVVVQILLHGGGQLKVLELEECKFNDLHFSSVADACHQMKQLRYLNFSKNALAFRTLMNVLPGIGKNMQDSLEVLKLSYCRECYEGQDDADIQTKKMEFRYSMEGALSSAGVTGSPASKVTLLLNELDEAIDS